MNELFKSSIIVSNEAVNGRYEYTSQEIDVLVKILCMMKMNSQEGRIRVPLAMMAEDMGSSNANYERIRKTMLELQRKPMEFFDRERKVYTVASLVSWCEIHKYKGEMIVQLAPVVLQLFQGVKEQFTTLQVSSILKMRKKYSKRLYMLCAQFKETGVRYLKPDELKAALKCGEAYSTLQDLERRVILPSLEEINEHSELQCGYEKLKHGRVLQDLVLTVKLKRQAGAVEGDARQREKMKAWGMADWQIENVFLSLDPQSIHHVLYNFQLTKDKVKNWGPYLVQVFRSMGVPMDRKIFRQLSLLA